MSCFERPYFHMTVVNCVMPVTTRVFYSAATLHAKMLAADVSLPCLVSRTEAWLILLRGSAVAPGVLLVHCVSFE